MRGITKLLTALVVAVAGFFAVSNFSGAAYADDCSSNAVIKCGFDDISQLRAKYDASASVRNIFSGVGISSDTVHTAAYKAGYVTKSGDVVADGKIVANNAWSHGRQYMVSGSTKKTYNGTTYYERRPSAIFATSQQNAMVFFDAQGRFIGAAIFDCGNPISATNVVVPPEYKCDSVSVATISRDTRKFTTSVTAKNGATLKDFVYDFGDGTKTTTTENPITHTYPELSSSKSYTMTVTPRFNVNGQVVSSAACSSTITISATPKINIEKTINNQEDITVNVGEPFEYELVVTNTGDVTLQNVTVSDTAPAGITFASANVGTIANNAWTYSVDSLAVGESFTVKINATADATTADKTVNTACVDTTSIPGSPDDCDTATVSIKIQVCDTDTNTIVWIKKSDAGDARYTTDLTQCEDVQVCNPETGDIITVSRNDEGDYADVNSDECKVEVCKISTKTIIKVDKDDADNSDYTTDLAKCEIITELPHTGIADTLGSILGVGSLTAATYYYIASRRS